MKTNYLFFSRIHPYSIGCMLILVLGLLPTFSRAQTISGTVFRDFNADGVYVAIPVSGTYTYGEPGVPGVVVTAYSSNSATAPVTVTTTASGAYTLNVGSTAQFRVEFTNVVTGDFDGFVGTDSKTSIQFLNGGTSSNDFGINYPAQYCGVANPYLVTSCYTNGNPVTAPSSSTANPANDAWLVGWEYDGTVTDRNTYLSKGAIGSTWGLAYHRTKNLLFSAAFLKRHSGFGTGGPGQIYTIDLTSPTSASTTVTEFVNLKTDLGIDVGVDPRIANPLPTDKTVPNYDVAAFDLVGKMSLGDIDISDDDRTLWVMNLFDQSLYELPIGENAAKPTTYTKHILPTTGCTSGVLRPFATKFYRGKVYVGAVCSGETGGAAANLKALVFVHDPAGATSNFTEVLSFPLDYARGMITSRGTINIDPPGSLGTVFTLANWRPWISDWNSIPSSFTNTGFAQTVCPQPVLSDIEFDVNGEMIVGFFDRFGHQAGNNNYSTITSSTAVYEAVAAGEMLRAGRKADGTYQIENNGSVTNIAANGAAAITVSSTAVNQTFPEGPGGGEFYWQDMYSKSSSANSTSANVGHFEILVGGLTTWPGSGEVVSTAYDPFTNFRAAGARYFDNRTGASNFEYQVLGQDGNLSTEDRVATFGKAASLGDLEITCDLSPIQIGNRVWRDSDNDGVQDPGEPVLAGVTVTLKGPGLPTAGVSVVTNANGEYYFSNSTSGTAATGFVYSLTGLTAGGSYSLTFPTSASAGTLTLSGKPNSATGTNADRIDTDPNTAGLVSFTLGAAGENNFTYDAAYVAPASLGDYVFIDANKDGIQNGGDSPLSGVTVTLVSNGSAVATTTTNATGLYSFTGLTPGIPYSVSFTTPTGYTATTPLAGTNTALDSNPINGITAPVTLTAGENNSTLDAGFYIIPASLGDYTFIDTNKDGIQNTGDVPLPGVTVTLFLNGSAVATTTTDASGFYSFTGLAPGTSNSYVVGFTAPAGYTATISNVGSDTADSDANPTTGRTQSVTLAPGENNPTLDAGFYLPTASLGNFVFEDVNKDGLQDAGDLPISGAVVTLLQSGTVAGTTTTDANGLYSFTGLTPGIPYSVSFTTPVGFSAATTSNEGSDDAIDSDPVSGITAPVTLTVDENNTTLDAGFVRPIIPASLGDYTFIDTNKDGIQNTGDVPLPGVTVTLFLNGSAIATTTTDLTGLYSFTGLAPGTSNSYVVGFTTPAGYTATISNVGSDTADSDANPTTGRTQSVTLAPGENNPTLDAGFYLPTASLGNFVFEDVNKDGLQDAGDLPIPGAVVTLLQSGTVAGTTTTDANGLYSFTGLTPGIPYSVSFTTPVGFSAATTSNEGSDDAIDSDPISGVTAPVTLSVNENNTTLDAGFVKAPTPPVTYAITKKVNRNRVEKGQIVTYTVSLTNTSATTANNVIISDAFSSSGLTVVGSGSASMGSFAPSLTGGTWTIPTLGGGQIATLSYNVQVNEEGLAYNVVTAPGGTTATACLTVPYHVCEGSSFEFELEAPANFSTYQWSLNGTPIPGATSATYSVTAVGEYTVATTSTAGCPDGSCCPFVVVADPAPSLTALAVAATCTGSVPLDDASITLVGSSTNAVSYNISMGTSFSASTPLFATNQSLAGIATGGVLKGGLANPLSAPGTSYTIRVYTADGCFSDAVVVIPPALCQCPPVKCAPFVIKKVTRR
ncbi:SdrD B-like domain-containing protein [Fibrella aquatica]|uniref:SdrD B-like domain-containing protein n=1 Tax=Fibrella aquatica TaxID=3242487 RepID=UPI0035220321